MRKMFECNNCHAKIRKPLRVRGENYCTLCGSTNIKWLLKKDKEERIWFGKGLRREIVKFMQDNNGSATTEELEYYVGEKASPSAIKYALRVMGGRGQLKRYNNILDMRKIYYCLNDVKQTL